MTQCSGYIKYRFYSDTIDHSFIEQVYCMCGTILLKERSLQYRFTYLKTAIM